MALAVTQEFGGWGGGWSGILGEIFVEALSPFNPP